jgi:hypothetical protein
VLISPGEEQGFPRLKRPGAGNPVPQSPDALPDPIPGAEPTDEEHVLREALAREQRSVCDVHHDRSLPSGCAAFGLHLAAALMVSGSQGCGGHQRFGAALGSSPLRLFADASYGGRELDFYDRGYWQNLSTWSFDNQLSSYKVGACGVYLADYANGGGSWYPGNTSAGHDEPTMLSGWNDRISSIYIH